MIDQEALDKVIKAATDVSDAARALAARRKSFRKSPDRRWFCLDCEAQMGTNKMRSHDCPAVPFELNPIACLRCGDTMTRSQTRRHKCEGKG